MKEIITRQYQEIVDRAVNQVASLAMPPEGWIRTMRSALGMSGAQLARRLNMARSQVAQAEKNELSGVVTLKTLDNMAQAMGCRVVYAIVPEHSAGDLISKQAYKRAKQIVSSADTQMALEAQTLSEDQRKFEIERIANELIRDMPSDLWNEQQ